MRLFHFVSQEYGLDDIKRRRLKVSLIDDMNDPFELAALELNGKSLRRSYRSFINGVSAKYGVLCFSKSWQNPLMWSHYADRHRGLVLGFDVSDNHCQPVTYRADRLPNRINARLQSGGLTQADMTEILSTKFSGWAYEDEVRVFVNLATPDGQTGLFFADFSVDLILREVVIGPRSKLSVSDVRRELVRTGASGVGVIKGRLAFKTFTVVRNRAAQ